MRVVTNTSPLIFLAKIGLLDLLTRLYEKLVIPAGVVEEISQWESADTRIIRNWIGMSEVKVLSPDRGYLKEIPQNLGQGERQCIAIAEQMSADLVILDDAEGRALARSLRISITGTIGCIVEAYEAGYVGSIRHELDRLREEGMWLSEDLYDRVLEDVGEHDD